MNYIKNLIVRWAIKQIVADSSKAYDSMSYLEDALVNEMGEKMFIFSHRLVPIDKVKLRAYNQRIAGSETSSNDSQPMGAKAPDVQ